MSTLLDQPAYLKPLPLSLCPGESVCRLFLSHVVTKVSASQQRILWRSRLHNVLELLVPQRLDVSCLCPSPDNFESARDDGLRQCLDRDAETEPFFIRESFTLVLRVEYSEFVTLSGVEVLIFLGKVFECLTFEKAGQFENPGGWAVLESELVRVVGQGSLVFETFLNRTDLLNDSSQFSDALGFCLHVLLDSSTVPPSNFG